MGIWGYIIPISGLISPLLITGFPEPSDRRTARVGSGIFLDSNLTCIT